MTLGALSVGVASFSQTQPRPGTGTPAQTAPPPQGTPIDPAAAPLAAALPGLDEKTRRGLAMQVALDRAGFSPGEIDGAPGANTDRAMGALKAAKGTTDLGDVYMNPVATYTISAEDAAGPFVDRMPEDMMEKSKLPVMAYASVLELLGERFHSSPKLLQRLNPNAKFEQGATITVPNVQPFVIPVKAGEKPADSPAKNGTPAQPSNNGTPSALGKTAAPVKELVTITVTDRAKTLQVQNAAGQVIFHAPVTVGSENDPLPVGEWKVNGVSRNPVFNYNPKLFWDADPSHAKAKIPPGPNNPVGVVWVDLSKEHYGIHGTPEPSRIGYTESHGCIRLTNWDAMRVAELVSPGTKVILR